MLTLYEGGVRGVRIQQYRTWSREDTVIPHQNLATTETAVTNGKKLTLSILQILLSNRNNTFISVPSPARCVEVKSAINITSSHSFNFVHYTYTFT